MRQIGTIQNEVSARRLIAFLLTQDIKAVAEKGDAVWDIWIKNEDDVPASKKHLREFTKTPDDPKYAHAIETANRLAREELDKQEKSRQNLIVMRTNWSSANAQRKPLVVTLMIITVAVFMTTQGWEYRGLMGGSVSAPNPTVVLKALLFVNPDDARAAVAQQIEKDMAEMKPEDLMSADQKDPDQYAEVISNRMSNLARKAADRMDIKLINIKQGEFWRLFTPMFIHFGIIHILFNMMWLNGLGGQFEHKLGTVRFGVFVLTAAVVSQVTQQMMPQNMQGTSALTLAGGMSGVNFALGGFIWMKSIYQPQTGFYLSPIAMFTLVLVLIIGVFDGGESVSMANWAHGAGFVFGLVCGYLPILRPGQSK